MRAFDGKWRYKAASEKPTSAASFAVVIRYPGQFCNINAKDSNIWCLRFGFWFLLCMATI